MKRFVILLVIIAVCAVAWVASQRFHAPNAVSSDNRQVLYYTCSMHPNVRSDKPGDCPICGMKLVPVYAKADALVATATSPLNWAANSTGRKLLYYQSAMHPWIKSDKPGKCPICGMDLVPVYEGDSGAETNMPPGMVKLNAESVSVINVQTDIATNRPIARTIHFAGEIVANSWSQSWFEFTAYQRDLEWLKAGQTLKVTLPGTDKIYTAQIKVRGVQPFADKDFESMTTGVKVRAELSESPVKIGELGASKYFNGLYAESHLVAETENVLAVPRTAVISRGQGTYVFVDKGGGYYQLRPVLLGRIGDDFAEVRANLDAGEKVVTTGNLMIDSEAQLANGQ